MSIFSDLDADQVNITHQLFVLLRKLHVLGEVETVVTRSSSTSYWMRIYQIYPKGHLFAEDLLGTMFHEGRTKEHVRR